MKKNVIRTIAVGTLALALASAPVFAKDGSSAKGRKDFAKVERSARDSDSGKRAAPAKRSFRAPGAGMQQFMQVSLMGTVTAVDAKALTLTVKDADGKDTKVHVNPYTRLAQSGESKPSELKLEEVKVGDWVMVNKFETGTTVQEARFIHVKKQD